jgi:hypothetical protein
MQVPGHVQYRVAHAQQVKHITGETVGIAYLTVGKGNVCLPCLLTVLTPIALYTQGQIAGLAAKWQIVNMPQNRAISDDMLASTMGADMSFWQDCFEIKENCIIFVLCTGIRIVLDSVSLI